MARDVGWTIAPTTLSTWIPWLSGRVPDGTLGGLLCGLLNAVTIRLPRYAIGPPLDAESVSPTTSSKRTRGLTPTSFIPPRAGAFRTNAHQHEGAFRVPMGTTRSSRRVCPLARLPHSGCPVKSFVRPEGHSGSR